MFCKRIILDEGSEATAILGILRDQCAAVGLSPDQTAFVLSEVQGPLDALIQSGRSVASASGQFRASRRIVTDSAAITLDARFGLPPGLFTRLRKALQRAR